MKKTIILIIALFIFNSLTTSGMLLCITPNNHIEFELVEILNCPDQHESVTHDDCCANEHSNGCFDITLSKISNIVIRQSQASSYQPLPHMLPSLSAAKNIGNPNLSKFLFLSRPLFLQNSAQKSIVTTVLLI